MKRIALIAALTALSLAPAASQAQGEKPAAAKPAPAAKVEKAAPARSSRSRANEDARICLELATNVEITKCAEKYR